MCKEKWFAEPIPTTVDESQKQQVPIVAREMRNISEGVIDRMVQSTLPHVMRQIRQRSEKGYTYHFLSTYDMIFPFSASYDIRQNILRSIDASLKKDGFRSFIFQNSIRIDW